MTDSSNAPRVLVSSTRGVMLFNPDTPLICVKQMPLPGIVIFVHGVNSDGEWYTASEEGLCRGLNARLGRKDDQLKYTGIAAGQLAPVQYIESLTADGFINPEMTSKTYVKQEASFSPVIHFRWGYKANKDELKRYGSNIFLNEQNYWGGGPFANGTSSLPDLWHEGLNDTLFLWITVQHLNAVPARKVYQCPPRGYMVLAALRLAKLIESIRRKQADTPITVVCHSQGNMIGMAAAFLGDRLADVIDPFGATGRCVADTYVLCNPPYSLVPSIGTDSWAQRGIKDRGGHRGRESYVARAETLKAYFEILRERAAHEPSAAELDEEMANTRTSESGGAAYNAGDDRTAHGLNGHTYGRVTLYCCPHDQVISAETVQGIGWRGLSDRERADTHADGVLTQRVFSSGFEVGNTGVYYHYWDDDWRRGKNKKEGFWFPASPAVRFSLDRGLRAGMNPLPQIMTLATAPVHYLVNVFTRIPVNASPDPDWRIYINAPALKAPFKPKALRYGAVSIVEDGEHRSDFNEGFDPPSDALNKDKGCDGAPLNPNDPYDAWQGERLGTVQTEAAQRYEDHAALRMLARRENRSDWVDKDGNVVGEDDPSQASVDYEYWRKDQIDAMLRQGVDNNATNHSTIMTNAEHAERALAYDVAIGLCYLSEEDLRRLRVAADWRFGKQVDQDDSSYPSFEYFADGVMGKKPLSEWVKSESEALMPSKIVDQRDGVL